MDELTGPQIRKLKKIAHSLKPLVQVGRGGVSGGIVDAVDAALSDHELIKVKFLEFKESRDDLAVEIAEKTGSLVVDRIGNVVILYRQSASPEKRKIVL